jgi:hypothetical protein
MKTNLIIYCLISLSLITSCKSIAQKGNSDTEKLISNLSWDSFILDVTYGTQLKLGETAIKLESKGKTVSQSLFKALSDTNKTVVVHMILTKIWEPEVFFLTTSICSSANDDDYSLYILNNLLWHKSDNDSLWLLDEKNKEIIINYWKARLN